MLRSKNHTIIRFLITASALIAFAIQMEGWSIIDPTYTDWLYVLNSDYSTHQLGWTFFREQPWGWPLGKLEQYAYPMVSSIGYTDSIPLLAFICKIFQGMLPDSFQYFGIWLLSCYLLQGFFGYQIGRRLSANPWIWLFLPLFLLIASPLLFRTPHPALCAQWLILAMLYLYLIDHYSKSIKFSALVIFISAFVHPYLMIMCLAIGLATYLKWVLKKKISIKIWLLLNLGTIFLVYIALHSIGYFLIQSDQAVGLGLGEFSANLNTFINSMDLGQLMPTFSLAFSGQYEGFAYLGTGLLIMGMISIFLIIRQSQLNFIFTQSNLPIFLAVLGLAILAVSPVITIGSSKIIEFNLGHNLFNTFRSSGRFIWPAYYSLVIFIFWCLSKYERVNYISGIVSLAFAIQCFDLWPLLNRPILQHQTYESPLEDAWKSIFNNVETVNLFPPYRLSYNSGGDVLHFLELARKTQTNITAGHLARRDDFIADSLYKRINLQFQGREPFQSSSVFITSISSLPLLKNSLDSKLGIVKKLQDYLVFIPHEVLNQNVELEQIIKTKSFESIDNIQILRLEEWLAQDTSATYILSVKDEASQALCDETKRYFENINSKFSNIGFRESYLGILKNNKVLYEEKGSRKLEYKDQFELYPGHDIQLNIQSAGSPYGNVSSIIINATEYSLNERGINVLRIVDTLSNLESANFDLYEQCAKVFYKPALN